MRKFIREYTTFNNWANDRICSVVASLNDEQLTLEMKSSFPTIRETLLHLWDTQDIWQERLGGNSPTVWPSTKFTGNKEDLINGLMKSSASLEAKARNLDKKKLKHKVAYTTLKGISGISPVYQILSHVVNHGTYHRGQLITMFRNAGVTDLPATDLIAFFRERDQQKKKKQS